MTAELTSTLAPSLPTPAAASERIPKPWGVELILARGPEAIVKLLRIDPGRRLSLQYHRRKEETLLVLGGEVELTIGTRADDLGRRRLQPGDRVHIPAGTIHRLAAAKAAHAEILEVASHPADQAHAPDADIVRLADDFGRA